MKKILTKSIQAIFFDLDGTYYDQVHYCIPKENIEAVRELQNHGYKVALATARPLLTIKDIPVLEDIIWDGIVCAGGQEVYDEHLHLLSKNTFTKQELTTIFNIAKIQNFPIYAVGDHAFFTSSSAFVDTFKKKFHIDTVCMHPYHNEEVLLITLLMQENFKYEPFFKHMKNVRIQYTGGINTDLFPIQVNKATSIHQLMQSWGFEKTNYMAFGDSGSDLEMMHDAGFSIAMGNGSKACKEAADYICGKSDELGIPIFLEANGFIE